MDPYVGEIRLFAGPYVPDGWVACAGQTLPISGNQELFTVIGTLYGGDGVNNFALPNLQVTLPVGQSPNPPPNMSNRYPVGSQGGAFSVTLTQPNLPPHTHALAATASPATTVTPGPSVVFAQGPAGFTEYADGGTPTVVALQNSTVSTAGANQPHDNMMPTLVINYIMCTTGIFPTFK